MLQTLTVNISLRSTAASDLMMSSQLTDCGLHARSFYQAVSSFLHE
jgi:hypothetical protein